METQTGSHWSISQVHRSEEVIPGRVFFVLKVVDLTPDQSIYLSRSFCEFPIPI